MGPTERSRYEDEGDPLAPSYRARATRRRQRRWTAAIASLAAVVVVLAAVTIAVSVSGGTSGPTASEGGGGSGSSARTTTGGTSPGTAGGPVVSSISPKRGTAGDSVVVTGTGFVSGDGQVLVHFGTTVAPTSCPSATSCRATVPASSGGSRVQVTVSTQAGTSNGAWFTYG